MGDDDASHSCCARGGQVEAFRKLHSVVMKQDFGFDFVLRLWDGEHTSEVVLCV